MKKKGKKVFFFKKKKKWEFPCRLFAMRYIYLRTAPLLDSRDAAL